MYHLICAYFVSQKGDSIKLQLKWVKQAQFAGYYAAAEQGFYAEVSELKKTV